MQSPVYVHADNPHERLYIAALDGTGNSMSKDAPENWSVVAKIYEQVRALEDGGVDNIRSGYVEGTFTQANPIARYIDGIRSEERRGGKDGASTCRHGRAP